jgi:hypothetical protein
MRPQCWDSMLMNSLESARRAAFELGVNAGTAAAAMRAFGEAARLIEPLDMRFSARVRRRIAHMRNVWGQP